VGRRPGNEIIANSAVEGGGVYFYGGGGTLVNNVIADNQASESGSGIYAFASSPVLIHSTIARNIGGDASGLSLADQVLPEHGVYNYSHAALTNTVLVSHSVGISLAMAVSNTVTLNGTLWQSDTQRWVGGAVTSTGSIDGDAAFAADGYHLTAGSAARGQGVNAGAGWDIDGEPRHNPPDLGADEYWSAGALRKVYLPLLTRQ
jgi:hypothetical protein